MKKSHLSLPVLFILLAGFAIGLPGIQTAQAVPPHQDQPPIQPVVVYPVEHDLSPKLESLQSFGGYRSDGSGPPPPGPFPKVLNAQPLELGSDPLLQTGPALANMPATGFNFEGVGNRNGLLPPDTNGDIGPNHYVQWVNTSIAVWQLDRAHHTANLVYGPTSGNVLWNGTGGACQTTNDGDPIVLYDHLADRWLISQFALPFFPYGPFYQCIAVSQTGDPTGAWHRYTYQYSSSLMNDYPKFGVWPDGYYMSVNQFVNGAAWGGAGVAVFERDKMLLGQTARMVYFNVGATSLAYGGMLPSDLDGPPPPAGTPNTFAEVDDYTWIGTPDALRLWQFHVDWTQTNNSTFGIGNHPNQTLEVALFTPFSGTIPQPGTGVGLDSLADRLMHRLQYRNFGTYASLVTNHTVNAGDGRAAVRWYELRNPGGGWTVQQQGTYAGDGSNSLYRWMGSAANDRAGNIAVGYSRSSSATYPGIAYTGRLVGDPVNTLPQGEAILIAGTGSQLHSSGRWGDYSMLGVDPTDDCTFWFTSEYYKSTLSSNWSTRIGSFTFPSCLAGLSGTLQGTVSSQGSPLEGATVTAGSYSTQTGPDGTYLFPDLPVSTYDVTATAYGYQTTSVQGVNVFNNQVTIQDFALNVLPLVNVHGVVRDGSGQGWPLYARLDISTEGHSQSIFTDPLTGAYQVNLPVGTTHSFQVSAVTSGYQQQAAPVTPALPDTTRDFDLIVDGTTCTAPGYALTGNCELLPGGLLVGHVVDANTDVRLNGASVTSDASPEDSTATFATPDDPAQDDGLYILFSTNTGVQSFTASKNAYGDQTRNATIVDGGVTGLSFDLPSSWLVANPPQFSVYRSPAETGIITVQLTIANQGAIETSFMIDEIDAPAQALLPNGPFAQETRRSSPKRTADLTAQAVYDYVPPITVDWPGGQIVNTWSSGLAHPWGIGYDARQDRLWIGDVALDGGDDRLHSFQMDGTPDGESIDTSSYGAAFASGLVYQPFSGSFWQASVGTDNCLFEASLSTLQMTGEKLCPPFAHSQRGLAFNPLNRTYYSGAWSNGILYHFDGQGRMLDSANLNMNISGLAYNPSTGHLFILSNAAAGFDVYVVDTQDSYQFLGGFDIPGLGDFQQGGMSMDCAGRLWVVNQETGEITAVESGETAPCAYTAVDWLSASPIGGSIPGSGVQIIQVVIDPNAAPFWRNQAQLVISSSMPYGTITIPVNLTIGTIFYYPIVYR